MRRTTAGALVAAVAAGAPAMAAQAPGASDDLGWAPTASASAPAEPAPAPGPDASPDAEPAAPPPDPAAGAPSGETSAAEAPAGDPPAAEAPSAPATTHQVSAGESLWSITEELLGAGAAEAPTDPSSGGPSAQARVARAWPILYAANAESIGADPDLILPGTVLSVPEDLLRPPSRP